MNSIVGSAGLNSSLNSLRSSPDVLPEYFLVGVVVALIVLVVCFWFSKQ